MPRILPQAIRVGLATALTGPFRLAGQQALIGVQAWVDDTNRQGGIRLGAGGRQCPVRLTYYDDASIPARCEACMVRLIEQDQVDILLGPYASGLTRRAAAVAQRYGRVLWNHGGSSDAIFAAGNAWVVGILTPASHYFHGVIAAVRQRHPEATRLAVVHTTVGTFAREVAGGAQQYGQHHGFPAVHAYQYPAATHDFTPLLQQLARDNIEVLLGVGRMEDDIRLAVQLRQAGLPLLAVGLIATPMTVFHDTLGPAADGFLGPSQWEPALVRLPVYGPTPQEVIASLRPRAPGGIDYPMAQAYAGGLVAQRCIELAGSLAPTALRQAANALDFTTFYGRFQIDPATGRQQGHVMPVVQWQQGRKVIIWP